MLEPGRAFIDGWAVRAICEHLEAVSKGQIKRLLINVPPGCMKSLTASVFWPAWVWGPHGHPEHRFCCASYSEALTIRDNRRCRTLILSPQYRAFWADRFYLVDDQNAKIRFDTDKTGYKIATSVGGLGTGERADTWIIDDPHKVQEAESIAQVESTLHWFSEVLPTRRISTESSTVITTQRTADRDVSAVARELGYDHLCLPMEYEPDHPTLSKTTLGFVDPRKKLGDLLWPNRFPRDFLDGTLKPELRAWGGTFAESAQLQQRPSQRGGGLFKKKDLQIVDFAPRSDVVARVRGWDLAATDDGSASYTCGVLLSRTKDGKFFIEDVERIRAGPHQVEETLKRCAQRDGKSTLISLPQDPGAAGKTVVSYLVSALAGYVVRSSTESGSKELRARPLAAQAEAGNLFLVRGPWTTDFINEASRFPRSTYKDQVDAASRAFAELLGPRRPTEYAGPEILQGSASAVEDYST